MPYEFITRISQVSAQEWGDLWQSDYPFIQHGFLSALEDSHATCAESGWQPHHLLIRNAQQQLTAAMVLFIKSHSYGEYVFDWSWADAYQQHGIHYYPKLVNAIPFTPATGPRFAASSTQSEAELLHVLQAHLQESDFSGFHSLFPSSQHNKALTHAGYTSLPHSSFTQAPGSQPNALEQDSQSFEQGRKQSLKQSLKQQRATQQGFVQQRLGCQFHWFNNDYTHFDDFLASFASRKRKNIKKERAKVLEHNVRITTTQGTALQAKDWAEFYDLYKRTYLKRSGHNGYLNAECFALMGQALPEQTLLVRAYAQDADESSRSQSPIAAALYFYDSHTLYGRYWGAIAELDGLHFECCYYRGIEFAIEQGLQRFDPGAQGEHKIARGFTPILTQSYHYLRHREFSHAITHFLNEEAQHINAYCQDARKSLPFKEDSVLQKPDCLINLHD